MVSTFGSLNTVVSGLQSHQTKIATTGHNLANVSTDGYSRQRVNLVTASSQRVYASGAMAQLGRGVAMQSITRIRDVFIDRLFWKENSILANHITKSANLSKVEDIFGEPGDTGMNRILNTFWESLNTLSKEASNLPARAVVVQDAVQLTTTIQQQTTQFLKMISDINVMVELKVDSINQITTELLKLNKQIVAIEAGKVDNANDLRDRRDWLIDQLSYLMDINVHENADGSYIVAAASGGIPLVTAATRIELTTVARIDADYNYEVLDVVVPHFNDHPMRFGSGEIAGFLHSRDCEKSGVKKYLNDLSNMSKFLLQEFNDVHKAGFDLNGNAGINFFGLTGTNYSTEVLSRGEWINHLIVNSDLTDPINGAARVAARTALGVAIQSNPQSGNAIIGSTNTNINDALTGLEGYEIKVDINDSDINGNVTSIIYTITDNNGVPVETNTVIVNPALIPLATAYTFDLGTTGLTIQIAGVRNQNTSGSYTFTVPNNPQGIAAGDNAINLCNRLKTDMSMTFGGSSLDTYYATMIGVLGSHAKEAIRLAENQKKVTDQLLGLRESVAGVNQEEELVDMVRFQKGYNAAARLLTAIDEMLDKLINGTGIVGR